MKLHLDRAHVQGLYRQMLRIRRFESRCVELYQAQKIRGFMHLYDGEEAVAAGVMAALAPGDAVVATYREHGQALARGLPMANILAEMLGKFEGCCRGRGGSMHLFDRERRFLAATRSSAAACRWPPASRWPISGCGPARSPPASSARAPWGKARSTKP